jgi:hypothetical protein
MQIGAASVTNERQQKERPRASSGVATTPICSKRYPKTLSD